MKGENLSLSITLFWHWNRQKYEGLVFFSRGCTGLLFMDDDSEHKVDELDDGWELDSEWTGEKESEIVSESDDNTAVLAVRM